MSKITTKSTRRYVATGKDSKDVQAGDKIRITEPFDGNDPYDKGEILTATRVDWRGDVVSTEEYGYELILSNEFEIVVEAAEVGGKIRITNPFSSFDPYEKGDVLSVKKIDEYGTGVKETEEAGGHYIARSEFEIVERAEERTEGRKEARKDDESCSTVKVTLPNGGVVEGSPKAMAEYSKIVIGEEDEEVYYPKKGDIVRVVEGITGGHEVGTIAEVVYWTGSNNPLVEANGKRYFNPVELVCCAEDRADRQ